jgi:putative addiction module component (TIGR02574 family)
MSETATKLLDQLLQLPEGDRVMVVDRLWESLSDESRQELLDETTSDPEFQAELQRRIDSVADGTAVLLEPEEVFAKIREHLRQKRKL